MTPEYFRRRAQFLIEGLRERFREIDCRDFPATTPSEVLNHLIELLSKIEGKLSSADERTSKLIIKVLFEYQKLLANFDNAHTEQTPRGLVRVLEDLLIGHRIHDGKCRLIAAPQATYNYTIQDLSSKIEQPIRNLFAKNEQDALSGLFGDPIFLIAFPRIERDNTLLHPVFGHEVGHIIAFKFLRETTNTPEFAKELQDAFAPIRQEITKKHSTNTTKLLAELQQQEVLLRQYWFRGLEELISDYVGLLLFGPSALFASYSVFSPSDMDQQPKGPAYYPPSRYRLRFGLQALGEEGFVSTFESLCTANVTSRINAFPSVSEWFKSLGALTHVRDDMNQINSEAACKAAYEWIEKTFPKAKAFAKSSVKAIVYTSDSLRTEVPELVERISLDLPPNEVGPFKTRKSVGWASAILAAWCYSIHGKRLTKDGPRDLNLKEIALVNKLTIRAVEGILMHARYQSEMGNA